MRAIAFALAGMLWWAGCGDDGDTASSAAGTPGGHGGAASTSSAGPGGSGASASGGAGGGATGGADACSVPPSPDPDVMQKLPAVYVDTTWVAPTGETHAVAAGGDLQAALDAAQPGDVITLAAGATFTGPFTLPKKSSDGYIVVRSDAPDASLPAPGERIDPSFADKLPKLLAPNTLPAVVAAPGAHHFRLVGLEIMPVDAAAQIYELVELGNGAMTTLAEVPHDILLDRLYIHGTPAGYTKRGVELDCASCAVIDSYVSDCHAEGQDAQALAGFNGPGPIKIVGNYLEGSGENVIFGGADPKIMDLVPSDIEIRRNHFEKPLTWKVDDPSYAGNHWSVKNLLELKNAQRVLVRCNVFEQNWLDAQVGFAILITPRNQDGTSPWCGVQDVTFTENILRSTASGINVSGEDDNNPSQTTARVVITGNLIQVDRTKWGGDGRAMQIITPGAATAGLKIAHNTAFVNGNAALVAGDSVAVASGFFYQDNITQHGDYGVFGSGKGEGTTALDFFFPGYAFRKNVLIGATSSQYPADNFFPATDAEVGFVDQAGGDYHLGASSMYKGAGTDGKDIGADLDVLAAGTKGVAP